MSTMTIGSINQSRSGNTVTLTFTVAVTIYAIHHVHWILYASNGTSILNQGEAKMVFNLSQAGNTYPTLNLDNSWMDCTITIPNATSGLYVILSIYTTIGQRISRRVQLT